MFSVYQTYLAVSTASEFTTITIDILYKSLAFTKLTVIVLHKKPSFNKLRK